jgi:hypothetical protein
MTIFLVRWEHCDLVDSVLCCVYGLNKIFTYSRYFRTYAVLFTIEKTVDASGIKGLRQAGQHLCFSSTTQESCSIMIIHNCDIILLIFLRVLTCLR